MKALPPLMSAALARACASLAEFDAVICKTRDDMRQPLKTPEQVRLEFEEAGISLAEWARVHGFHRMTVVDVLRGHRQGKRGEAHQVAVALGLKAGRVVDPKKFNKPLKEAA